MATFTTCWPAHSRMNRDRVLRRPNGWPTLFTAKGKASLPRAGLMPEMSILGSWENHDSKTASAGVWRFFLALKGPMASDCSEILLNKWASKTDGLATYFCFVKLISKDFFAVFFFSALITFSSPCSSSSSSSLFTTSYTHTLHSLPLCFHPLLVSTFSSTFLVNCGTLKWLVLWTVGLVTSLEISVNNFESCVKWQLCCSCV